MRYDPAQPNWAERDRFVMSKGHATGALYTVLAAAGLFSRRLARHLHGAGLHAERPPQPQLPARASRPTPARWATAFRSPWASPLPGRLPAHDYRTFVLTGDGELQEGSNWEAAMTAGHRKLRNLTLIVDRNRLQQGAGTEETNGLDPLDDKYRAFGWDVVEVDGHDVGALLATSRRACR